MSNITCLMSNESACGLLSGVFLLGGGLGILLYKVCTIKNFVKDGKVYRNILEAPVYGTCAAEQV